MRSYQLAVVFVWSDHVYVEALGGAAHGHRAYHIVGLETLYHQHRNIEGLNDGSQGLKRVDYQLRSFTAIGLVLRVQLITESASGRVETHCDVSGVLPVDKFQEILCKAEQNGCILALGINHGTPQEGIIHFENERVAVYEKKFHIETQKYHYLRKFQISCVYLLT